MWALNTRPYIVLAVIFQTPSGDVLMPVYFLGNEIDREED
jgi:hypothetical protein